MDCGILILTPTPTLDPSRAPSSPEGCSSGMRSQRRPQLLFLRGSLPSPQPPGRASQGRTDEGDQRTCEDAWVAHPLESPTLRAGRGQQSRTDQVPADLKASLPRPSPGFRPRLSLRQSCSLSAGHAPSSRQPRPARPRPPGCQARVLFCWRVSCLGFLEAGAAASSVGRTQVPCGKLGFAPLGLILSRSISISQAFTMFPFKVSV